MKTPNIHKNGDPRPLVAHVIHRLGVGGLENGLVNLINHMPPERYRHAIVCMTDYTDFRLRIQRSDVACYALHKKLGQDPAVNVRLWRLLKSIRPQIVHTRNIGTLEGALPAFLAGTRRIHGEHGRDVSDIDGSNRKYIYLRKAVGPLVNRFVTVSRDLQRWLNDTVGIASKKIVQIYNGVDMQRFHPAMGRRERLPEAGFAAENHIVIGTVGRMQGEKDPLTLVRSFAELLQRVPNGKDRLRLVLIGDGPLRKTIEGAIEDAGIGDITWLAGERKDIPALLRALDIFVLPSLGEGISNTILEAMASGLPVVATRVGGNTELVTDGETGQIVPPADATAMAAALAKYSENTLLMRRHGQAGRARVEREFSMEAMVSGYLALYDGVLSK